MEKSMSTIKDGILTIGPNQGLPCFQSRPCSTTGTCNRHVIGAWVEISNK